MTAFSDRRRDRRTTLSTPAGTGRLLPRITADTFGALSERIARFFGTARFLVIQTVIVAIWIALNLAAATIRWDPYPFILLNLAFSTQAAYAAPFILLAQNRQADRDRIQNAEDRAVDARQRATTDYITVELAALRLAQNEAATREYIDRVLTRELTALRQQLVAELRDPQQPGTTVATQQQKPAPSATASSRPSTSS
jgi:uncharacterized membrane protein